jgi:23S rRNA pseudouridine1911/1915/1917 synthase
LGYLWAAAPQGLKATSHCQVLARTPENSLLEVTIPTGRSHQIRIHLAAWGHPLVGDPLYTHGGLPLANAVPGDLGYWLHSWRLIFRHPETKEKLTLICPPPVDCLGL